MQIRFKQFKQAGISLLEVLLSLSIIAIILVMATRYFFVANNSNKINTARQQVGAVVAAVNAWKDKNPTYQPQTGETLEIATLYNDGFLAHSSSLVTDGGAPELYNPWGYQITVSAVSGTSAQLTTTLPNNQDCKMLNNSYPDAVCSDKQFTLTIGANA